MAVYALLLTLTFPGVDYPGEIKPLLARRCVACHGALEQKGGLRLDTAGRMRAGGDSGPAVVPGKPGESAVWLRAAGHGSGRKMPPKGEGEPFSPADLALLEAWIALGAAGSPGEAEDPDPRDHWAFRKPVRVPMAGSPANPIDYWLARGWTDKGLSPRPGADKSTLLRRLHLDLTGLPPSASEIDRFLGDDSADAYTREVERLLASPAHAERWARHFMDIWRYSDWWGLGAEVRNSQKNIWNWRDWIIESVERDLPYDEMIRQMFAADELYPADASRLRATGFLARQYFLFNRTTWMDETIEHTGKAILGLTTNCAKCHDHKYDPIRSEDYYRLRAIFEPYQVRYDAPAGSTDPMAGFPRVFDNNLGAVTHKHTRGDESRPETGKKIRPGVPPFLNFTPFDPRPVPLATEARAPETRPDVLAAHLAEAEKALAVARAGLAEATREWELCRKPDPAAPPARPAPLVSDPFTRLDAARWTPVGNGTWKTTGEAVAQTAVISGGARLRLADRIPSDFEATLRFRITGGDPYQSVGVAFDLAGGGETLVYMSAHAPAPKIQVSYKSNGAQVYPAQGRRPWKIPLGTTIELAVRAFGNSIEAEVDGSPAVAFSVPGRGGGPLELVTFTATAEFDHFEIRPLPPGYKPGSVKPLSPAKAEAKVEWARAELAAHEAGPAVIRARHKARVDELARGKEASRPSAREAAKLESEWAVRKARSALAKARFDTTGMAAAPKAAVEGASKALEAAEKAATEPGDKYTRLSASLMSPESNLDKADPRLKTYPDASTGRRTALARWITHPDNPLTARVIVNHIWNRHFGQPLVATVFDFGRKGARPTHPELLDALAVELMENKWSMRHIHRLIVKSRAYQLESSAGKMTGNGVDSDNRYLWRFPAHRLESQAVRDSLLLLAGGLDTSRGGPSIPAGDESSRRRSIYFVHSHNDHNRFLSQFDDAGVQECYLRSESIVPQQSMALVHARLAGETAMQLVPRLDPGGDMPPGRFVRRAFLVLLGREPDAAEADACGSELASDSARARAGLLLALINHHDFITIR